MAVLNTQAGTINIETILNNAATTTTDTTLAWADTEVHEIEVRVGIDRVAKFFVDGVEVTDVLSSVIVASASASDGVTDSLPTITEALQGITSPLQDCFSRYFLTRSRLISF
jgi:hypothetical protein